MTETEQRNKALVLEAFDTLFNKRDYAAAERFWSADYIQHSAHIQPGREGLFGLVNAAPPDMRYENALITANGDYVMLHGRFWNVGQPANWIVADIVGSKMVSLNTDVIQDEATAGSPKWAADVRRHLPTRPDTNGFATFRCNDNDPGETDAARASTTTTLGIN
jgi:predicted SnoaL-like aldol condensation-catalyzing enzyme